MTTTIQNTHYERAKAHYESIKPIRGSDNLRPTGDRRKQWMTIRQDGENYVYRLYSTDCVTYTPTQILIDSNKWATPTTADFITTYTPINMYCVKQYKKLWLTVRVTATSEDVCLPVSPKIIIDVVDNKLVLRMEPILVRTVDRAKAKQSRSRLDAFIKWGTTMLKLSDGWLSMETLHEAGAATPAQHRHLPEPTMADLLAVQEPDYLRMYVQVLRHCSISDSRPSSTGYGEMGIGKSSMLWEQRYTPEVFKRKVISIHDADADIHTAKTVKPGPKPLCNVM
jgi:hypothetical protein